MSEVLGELIKVLVVSLVVGTVAYGLVFATDMFDEWVDGRRGR